MATFPIFILNLLFTSNVKLLVSYLNSNNLVTESIDKPLFILTPFNSYLGFKVLFVFVSNSK